MENNRYSDISYLSEVVQNFIEVGNLSLSLYRQFWSNLNNPDVSTVYLSILLTKLIGLDTGDRTSNLTDLVKKYLTDNTPIELSAISTKNQPEEVIALKASILNTVYFLALHYKFNPEHPHLREALRKYGQVSMILSAKVDTPNDRASRLEVASNDVETIIRMSSFEPQVVLRLVDQCSTIDNAQPSLEFFSEKVDPKCTLTCLFDNLLRAVLAEEAICSSVLSHIIPISTPSTHPREAHGHPPSYAQAAPKVQLETLQQSLSAVKNYYLWPRPYGDIARDLLLMLTIELKAPGSAMRKKILEENPDLIKGSFKTGRERTIHLLYDRESTNARITQELLKIQTVADTPIPQLQVNILANILASILNCDVKSFGLEGLSQGEVARYFEAALQILSEAILMNQTDAENFRVKELSTLKDEIIMCVNPAQKVTSGLLSPGPPALLPLNFEFTPVSLEPVVFPPTDENPTKYKYPKRMSYEVLTTIIGKYAPYADVNNKPVIRIGLIGGDNMPHTLISSYVYLRHVAPKSFDGLDVQFFMIPVESCLLSTFLCRYDAWYSRNMVYLTKSVLRSLPCLGLPQPAFDGGSIKGGDMTRQTVSGRLGAATVSRVNGNQGPELLRAYGEEPFPHSPATIMRNEAQNYFREAKWRLEINLYQCESADGVYYTIPFFQRAEINFRSAEFLSKQQGQKNFKFAPPSMSIKFTQMNPFGVPKQGTPIEARTYSSVVLTNLPLPQDRGVPPNPTKPWLELSLVEVDKKKKSKEETIVSLHTSMVDLEAEDKKKYLFPILLDNTLYGPFARVKITPILCNEEILNATFMTFSPMDLPS